LSDGTLELLEDREGEIDFGGGTEGRE